MAFCPRTRQSDHHRLNAHASLWYLRRPMARSRSRQAYAFKCFASASAISLTNPVRCQRNASLIGPGRLGIGATRLMGNYVDRISIT